MGCKIIDYSESKNSQKVTYVTKCGWKKTFKDKSRNQIQKIKKHKCI